jgi:hypothetical protein
MMQPLITHRGDECQSFFEAFITTERRALFIGTLGFNDLCLFFPRLLAKFTNVDFLFLVEKRPEVAAILEQAALRNRDELQKILAGRALAFTDVAIVADDTAIVAGRTATAVCKTRLGEAYSDIFVDATAMSRGVCFPITKQIYELSRSKGANAHILVAGRTSARTAFDVTSMSSDRAEYMHGFQGDMGVHRAQPLIKLWIPQLSERSTAALGVIHGELKPDEVCPILPFPSSEPLRGDRLLREFKELLTSDWEVNLLDVIYGHESDPTDVYETIKRIHIGRSQALTSATSRPARTVLSPVGTRIGSVGMLFAALELDLPVLYAEAMGYTSAVKSLPPLDNGPPEHLWHIWLRP